MAHVILRDITKRFGSVVAVDRLNLGIERGECLSLLGPSGCGKTTTLRMLAGFEVGTTSARKCTNEASSRAPWLNRLTSPLK